MKRTILAVTVFAVASCSGEREKPVQVTAQTIASQPAERPYVIDLTRSGASYDVAAGLEYTRLQVRTSTGDMGLNEFVSRRRHSAGKRLLLGSSLDDLIDALPPDSGGGVAEATCDRGVNSCYCNGRKDCSDLSKSGKCKSGPSDAICGEGAGGGTGWGCSCRMK